MKSASYARIEARLSAVLIGAKWVFIVETMNKELLNHVFGSLNSLERYFERLETETERSDEVQLPCTLEQLRKALKHMRRTAVRLQLQFAHNDQSAITRSLNVYYSLHSMVRPEIFHALATLHSPSVNRLASQIAAHAH